MFRQLHYQDRVLSALDWHLDHLKEYKAKADRLAENNPELKHLPPIDFTEAAWKEMKRCNRLPASRHHVPFSPRRDGCNRPVPNAVLKVPTGGGKTWLAVNALSCIMGRYLERNTGFALWIVPNEAIYSQTIRNLRDRRHPYRKLLDLSAAGRVLILEKTSRLIESDVRTRLCVMLLMLQSSNRQNREALKMFQDRGDVHGFCPPEGDHEAHRGAFAHTPNLDGYDDFYPVVKDSLGNALRIIRPVVILDEGHRATSDLAHSTIYGFNPCFVLELTATPHDMKLKEAKIPRQKRNANVLVDVSGRELEREGMIKMPINLDPRQGTDWKSTLHAAIERLDRIRQESNRFRADSHRHIRPLMLIQVERTGTDQREAGFIHAADVREQLLIPGFAEDEIAIKTAEQNDLKQPENQDLLSPTNRIRAIITKQALQEGWDCPFAYVLCALAASSNLKSMTQLVGRILRQPHSRKTGIPALDECFVITHHAQTALVVQAIKRGLSRDGLGDLAIRISSADEEEDSDRIGSVSRRILRRPEHCKTRIYLPKVMHTQGEVRELDYVTDIVAHIDWRGHDTSRTAERIPRNAQAADTQMRRIRIDERNPEILHDRPSGATGEVLEFDRTHAVACILDVVPNPFVGWEIVEDLLSRLRARGFDDSLLGRMEGHVIEELRKDLLVERDRMAEERFRREVLAWRVQFRLRLDGNNWKMPDHLRIAAPEDSQPMAGKSGGPLRKSLFHPIFDNDMNREEREVAVFLDRAKTLAWWHRNVARKQYGIQGWNRNRIYPDFILATGRAGRTERILILETKGDFLDNLDTDYKREVLSFLTEHFRWEDTLPAGRVEIVGNTGETVQAELVLMSEWKTRLPAFFAHPPDGRD